MLRTLFSLHTLIIAVIFFIVVFSNFHESTYAAGLPVFKTRGQNATLTWSVTGATRCTPSYSGTLYPDNSSNGDTLNNQWLAQTLSSGSISSKVIGNSALAFPQTYVFKCTEPSGVYDTATLTVTDCVAPQVWNSTSNSCVTPCVTSWLAVPQANIDASGLTCASVAPYATNLSSYSPSHPTWTLNPAPAQPTKTSGTISATYDSCNINNVTINRSACTIAADPSQCGPGSGVTPQLTEPTASSACSGGVLNSSSPADTLTSGAQAWNWSCGTVTSCSAPKYGCRVATDSNYTLPQYGANGPNNNYGCASTCANGESNYPTCTPPAPIAEPTFSASCTLQSGGKYNIALTWNAVSGATNYPVRITNPSGTETDIGMGAVGDGAPTGTSYTFTGLSGAGTYTYWGHAWSSTKGWSSTTARAVNCPAAGTCNLPWGGTLANGGSVTAYLTSSVTSPSTCTSQTRTCTNGTLSGSYTNQTCSVTTPSGCTTPWGTTLTTGQTVTAYESDTTSGFCNSETRRCLANGSLSGTFQYSVCGVLTANLVAGAITPISATANTGVNLQATISNIGNAHTVDSLRNTNFGGFYNFIQVATGANGGGTITDLGRVFMSHLNYSFSNTSAVTTKSYTFPSAGTYSARACADKSTSAEVWGDIAEDIYEGDNCGDWTNITVTASSCTAPWGTTVLNGASVTAYQSASVISPSTCTSQTRTCTNGTLSGSYTNQTCTVTSYPNLTADAVTPTTAMAGTPVTLSANINNTTTVAIGTSFSNFIQIATASNGGGTITDLGAVSMASLGASASAPTTKSYTFPSTGTYSARACADKTNRNTTTANDSVDENTNEGDNCGPWTDITVGFQCPAGQYWVSGITCDVCSNGGCAGSGGTPSTPYGGLVCTNGSLDVPLCTPADAHFTSTPSCTISANQSSCFSPVSWTSSNLTTVALTDCAGGLYITRGVGAQTYSTPGVTVPYGGGCYELHNSTAGGTLLDTVNGPASCMTGTVWNGSICEITQPTATLTLSGNYTVTGKLTATCSSNANEYTITRTESPSPAISSGAYTGTPITANITLNGNYVLICTSNLGGGLTRDSLPATVFYEHPAPGPTVSIKTNPSTIIKGASTELSWLVKFPVAGCKLTAEAICSGGVCNTEQLVSSSTLNELFKSGRVGNASLSTTNTTTANRTIAHAVNGVDLVSPTNPVVTETIGKITNLKVNNTMDFKIDCGNGAYGKARVNVTTSNEG